MKKQVWLQKVHQFRRYLPDRTWTHGQADTDPRIWTSTPYCEPGVWRKYGCYKRFSNSKDILWKKPGHMERQTQWFQYVNLHIPLQTWCMKKQIWLQNGQRLRRYLLDKTWTRGQAGTDPRIWTSTPDCEPSCEPVHPTANLAHEETSLATKGSEDIFWTKPEHTDRQTLIRISLGQDQQGLHFSMTSDNCPLPRPVMTLEGSRTSHHSTAPADGPWGRRQAERLQGPGAAAAAPSGLSTEPAGASTPSPLSLLSWKGSQARVRVIYHCASKQELWPQL